MRDGARLTLHQLVQRVRLQICHQEHNAHNVARWIVQDALNLTFEQYFNARQNIVTSAQYFHIQSVVRLYNKGMPLARIFGKKIFFEHEFQLNDATLEPRPETEELVAWSLEVSRYYHDVHQPLCLDLGTGSGCILLSFLYQAPHFHGIGVDYSFKALQCAADNAEKLHLTSRTSWLAASWLNALKLKHQFHVIMSNPPYISQNEQLPRNVLQWDPPLALYGGNNGLRAYEEIIPLLSQILHIEGVALFEIGHMQADDLIKLARQFFSCVYVRHDLYGHRRYIAMTSNAKVFEKTRYEDANFHAVSHDVLTDTEC